MNSRPKILLTNDDGISAAGLHYLWKALKDITDLTIVAPTLEQSSVALSITVRHPLLVQSIPWEANTKAWSVNGTPADCIKLALSVLDIKPDLVVSGINRGGNAGRNMLYSGTVAGAIEAILHDVPSAAFSCLGYPSPDYELAALHISPVIEYLLNHPLPSGTLLNVNFPESNREIQGFKMTRQGKAYWAENPERREHPSEGHSYYWLGSRLACFDEEEDCDISWLDKGYITAVPLHIGELTDHNHLSRSRKHFESLFNK